MINKAFKFATGFSSRYQAFAYHLVFSILIAGGILLLAKFIWYPNELVFASGAIKIFLIVILVDACFGPLLTLVVYNPYKDKKVLDRDLFIIVLLQICALVYGSFTLVGGRPVYYVFAVDRFELVQANDIPQAFIDDDKSGKYANLPKWGPRWVYSELPNDVDERNDILFKQVEFGIDLAQTPQYYKPLEVGYDSIRARVRPLKDLQVNNDIDGIEKTLMSLGVSNKGDYGYLPLAAKKKDLTIVIHKSSLEVAGIVNLNPWREGE